MKKLFNIIKRKKYTIGKILIEVKKELSNTNAKDVDKTVENLIRRKID